ncbi:uncharacterized protein MELLADRAFT_78415 [Melampsora larici-populina 98AG31]|uniref:Uncharacterized protein n=1 Tax=Melampsora larici-populina (strain 98AG31 / pathotype 3-4-7) TaxID=747676 RepID=F4RU33_MELLP|nr:uncharacterized protein MELLADRAFT_78415 [Melampsora larici-populina 98AG31]EGG04105.1 hypothetical protein MELLADRAFT_78415 [Melampsora larici-populina 98AG31]
MSQPVAFYKLHNVFKYTIPPHLHKFIERDYDFRLATKSEHQEIHQIFFPQRHTATQITKKDILERFEMFVLPCILACSIWRPSENLLVYYEELVPVFEAVEVDLPGETSTPSHQ